MHLNRTGQRTSEDFEPPAEKPELIGKAVEVASRQLPLNRIATDAGMPPSTFETLLALVKAEQESFPA